MTTNTRYLYHLRSADFVGNTIYPLNRLKSENPKVFETQAAKYKGREALMKAKIPPLDCLWNDVIHLSPIDPREIYKEMLEAKRRCFPDVEPNLADREWFRIPFDLVKESPMVLYRNDSGKMRPRIDLFPDDAFEVIERNRPIEDFAFPEIMRTYYDDCYSSERALLLFAFLPHVLVNAPINIDGVETINWSE